MDWTGFTSLSMAPCRESMQAQRAGQAGEKAPELHQRAGERSERKCESPLTQAF